VSKDESSSTVTVISGVAQGLGYPKRPVDNSPQATGWQADVGISKVVQIRTSPQNNSKQE